MSEDLESGIPEELRYSEQHEWVSLDDDAGTIGITDYAQTELGDIVFVELPEVGERFEQGQSFGSVEAVKAVEDLYCPVSGEVIEVNAEVKSKPELVNEDAYGDGWLMIVRPHDFEPEEELLEPEEYLEHLHEV